MKKAVGVGLGALVGVAMVVVALPVTRDEIHWRRASSEDAVAGYQSYLQTWPEGRHAAEAQERCDELGWAETRAANTVEGFRRYLQAHAKGKHRAEAEEGLDAIDWLEATAAHTIRAYQVYLTAHFQGRRTEEAQARIAALATDDAPFAAALQEGTQTALARFLEDYPGHQREADARRAVGEIAEGRDIVDLLEEKKIDVEASGHSIEEVAVRLRRRVPYALTVRIPVGTFFVSADPSSQNMVATAACKVQLTSDAWEKVSPRVACANRPKHIPHGGDKFTIRRSPKQAELARLVPVLEKAEADTGTTQAAVWIVTDDATYADLGTLIGGPIGLSKNRVIKEPEAALAMKLCHEAGIDIRKKAIWRDRASILVGIPNPELRKWLEGMK